MTWLDDFVWGIPMIVLLLGTHLFMTLRTGFIQRKTLTGIKLSVTKDPDSPGDVSQFQALTTALASTIGTGNIIGVGTAIFIGGPGAVLWCWLTGVFGIATKYSESLIAVKYRVQSADGRMQGGAMYALERGLNMKWLGILFAFFATFASFGIGNATQINAIAEVIENNINFIPTPRLGIGIIFGIITAVVILGGIKSIATVCEKLVPFMAVVYIVACVIVLVYYGAYLPAVFSKIFTGAFSPEGVTGGAVGSVILVITWGVKRGVFSNEAGLGSAPMAHAATSETDPVKQGLYGIFEVFMDTIVICSLSGLTILCAAEGGALNLNIGTEGTTALNAQALGSVFTQKGGAIIIAVGLALFAFSTILSWALYGTRCCEFLFGSKAIKPYQIIFLVIIFVGATMELSLAWSIADTLNGLMAIPNLIALVGLSGVVVRETKRHFSEKVNK